MPPSRRLFPVEIALLVGLSLSASACRPDLGDRESLITSTRVLAVRGEPPEAKPGEPVTYDLLLASPDGHIADLGAEWAFCTEAKALADNRSVSSDCLGEEAVRPIGGPVPVVTAAVPDDACVLFGPDVPPGGFRPRDADVTGGYYQPVRVRAAGHTAFGMERISCNLADAPIDIVTGYLDRYEANKSPTIMALSATIAGAPVALDSIVAGSAVSFELAWAPGDAQTYPVFDREAQALVDRREALRVSWFATAGTFQDDRTGLDETQSGMSTSNVWTAPEEAGTVHLWVVLRDSRGGVDFATYELEAVP